MVSVETYLLQSRRRMERLLDKPGVGRPARALGCFLAGFVLSGGRLWGVMQPLGAAGVFRCGGWNALSWGIGASLSYRLFFGSPGRLGIFWTLCALSIAGAVRLWNPGRLTPAKAAGGFAGIVGLSAGLVHLLKGGSGWVLPGQMGLAAAGAALFVKLRRSPESPWRMGERGLLIGALGSLSPDSRFSPGLLAGGFLACGSLAQGALAGAALDAAGAAALPVTAVFCLAALLRQWLGPNSRLLAACLPGACAGAVMALTGQWNGFALAWIALGGALGGVLGVPEAPMHIPGSTGAAQVRLEQMSRLMTRLRLWLLETDTEKADEEALADRLRRSACGSCNLQTGCAQRQTLGIDTLRDPLGFQCRRTGRVLQELRRSQDQLRLLRAGQARQRELRRAMSRQYAFLAAYLSYMADRLPGTAPGGGGRFRIHVAVRSRSRERADGDRCLAFRGMGGVYYVALCDGMGTGLGASEDSREVGRLLGQILTAGLPPRYALNLVNTQMILTGACAASTVDLAQIRLDTGQATLYKWGAAESYHLYRGKTRCLGGGTPPPGIGLEESPEILRPVSLDRGATLVMVTDGLEPGDPNQLGARWEEPPAELAAWLVRQWGSGTDDATAAVIRLLPEPVAP